MGAPATWRKIALGLGLGGGALGTGGAPAYAIAVYGEVVTIVPASGAICVAVGREVDAHELSVASQWTRGDGDDEDAT